MTSAAHRRRFLLRLYESANYKVGSSVNHSNIRAQRLATTCEETKEARPKVRVHSALGADSPLAYARGWAWQHVLLSQRLEERRKTEEGSPVMNDHDCVLLFEHSPVYTLGRGADENHLTFLNNDNNDDNGDVDGVRERLSRKKRGRGSARLSIDNRLDEEIETKSIREAVDSLEGIATPVIAPNGTPIYRIERGGEVTYHGPGQLVCYPLLDLKRKPFKKDLHWYLRMLEQVIIETLRELDIEGVRDDINTGVWVDKEKVAAVGVSSSKWITTHGFALNVTPDMTYFDTSCILPCGIEGREVTSIDRILKQRQGQTNAPSITRVASIALEKMEEVFGIELDEPSLLE